MHDELFEKPDVVARYQAGPYVEARERFLRKAGAEGYSRSTLKRIAWVLLIVAEAVQSHGGSISSARLRGLLSQRVWLVRGRRPSEATGSLLRRYGEDWLRSIGALLPETDPPLRFARELGAFAAYMRVERGLSPVTIAEREVRMRRFFAWLPSRVRSLSDVTIGQIDAFLAGEAQRGWSRTSLHSLGSSLRCFFRYAAQQGWCAASLTLSIDLPRRYELEGVPMAPTVDEVDQLLATTAMGDDPVTIRDHAVLLLLIQYGLRRGEVERLTLDDIDWVAETLHVMRPKLRRPQCYPLSVPVGESILRYLRDARPRCRHRAVFLTINAPFRPLSGSSISAMVRMRLRKSPARMCGSASGCRLHPEADRRPSRPSQHEQHPHLYEDRCAGPASGGRAGPGNVAMSTDSTIADYIRHNRCLGMRFITEAAILSAFSRSVGKMPLRDIRPAMIRRFVNREGTSDRTIAKKYSALKGFFRYALTRGQLKVSPLPSFERKRGAPSFTPYIYSEAELKRILAAVPAATGPRCGIDADTLRTFVLLLYGAGLRRGEARRLKVEDVDLHRSLLHIKETKFFKTRIVPISTSLSTVLKAFVAKYRGRHSRDGEDLLFTRKDGTPLPDAVVTEAFRRLRTLAGIKRDGGARNQPRLHDLRHSAAVHRVTSWYRSGADLNDLLPKLATYLGHKNLAGTQRYLTMTEELLAEAGRRFEAFAQGGRHD